MGSCDSYGRYAQAHGRSDGSLFYPHDMEHMIYLGTHLSSEPLRLYCGKCNYQGMSDVKREKGIAWYTIAVLTLGISRGTKMKEVHHYCPSCGTDCAYSKPL